MKYQTLYIASAGAQLAAGAVDSVAFWNQKPDGISGNCTLVGFNSARAPAIDRAETGTWRTTIGDPLSCININGWTPFSWFDLSADGKVAVAWLMDDNKAVTVFGLDGQTGALRWSKKYTPMSNLSDYYLAFGFGLSRDGAWAVMDEGYEGFTPQYLHVLSTADGSVRDTVAGAVFIQGSLSPDGTYILTCDDASTPTATVHKWNPSSKKYEVVGNVSNPAPPGGVGITWELSMGSFGVDKASGKTVVAIGWFDRDLSGEISVGVFDVANPAAGPISYYVADGLNNNYAVDYLYVDCSGLLCAAALQSQAPARKDRLLPTFVLLSGNGEAGAKMGPLYNVSTYGTLNSVAVTESTDPTTGAQVFYVGAAGCDSFGECNTPGADAFLWKVTGV